ncbi:MAG: hypothetical protein Q8R63_08895, partial [Ramlibacter sp.]|nr:hypothetical protein [Ramlibacter sp.]
SADNTASALAQGTRASNTLALDTTGTATQLSGAIASTQSTTAAVTATVRPETGTSLAVISVDGASFTSTPVVVSRNRIEAGAGQNSATNAQTVTGGDITGSVLPGIDFTTSNSQTGTGDVTALALPGHTGLIANTVTTGAVTARGNLQLAAANVNDSTNSLLLDATSGLTANGLTTNVQNSSAGAISATVGAVAPDLVSIGVTGLTAAGVTYDTVAVTVNRNITEATAGRNIASNSLTAQATTLTGTGGPSFETRNDQTAVGAITSAVTVGTVGAGTNDADDSSFTVARNRISSLSNSNAASSSVALAAESELTSTGLVRNDQVSNTGTVGATVTTAAVGVQSDVVTNSRVSVVGNIMNAESSRNVATNALTAQASTLTGGTSPSFESRNRQTADGVVTSQATVGLVGATANAATDTTLNVARNRISSLSNANTATSSVALTAETGVTSTGLVDNDQQANTGAISAAVTSTAVGVQGAVLSNTKVTVVGNVLNAEASRNVGTNTLMADASTIVGNGAAPAYRVLSNQSGSGDVVTTTSLGLVGATQTTTPPSAVNPSVTSFGVVDNIALAASNVNIATNRLVLNAVSTLTSRAEVSNTQNAGAVATLVTATVGGTADATRAMIGVTAPVLPATNTQTDVPTTVTGNVLSAQGGGNTSNNTLEGLATTSIAGGTFPVFGVLNTQTNAAEVRTTVSFANIGNTVGGTATNVTTTVSGNQANALSYGNSASNSLLQSAIPSGLNTASSAIYNTQFNSANMTATVTGVSIGMNGGGTTGGSTTIVNNSISARAVGNSATNMIGIK